MQKEALKTAIKSMICRMTEHSKNRTMFAEALYCEASEIGISESHVKQAVEQLKEEKYIEELFNSKIIKRLG